MIKISELFKRIIAVPLVLAVFFLAGTEPDIHSFADGGSSLDNTDNPIIVDPTDKQGGWISVLYDNRNGLPTTEANAVAETSDGFIWIGSYGGLIRYDGNTFERQDSTGGITSVLSLFVDDDDRLWIGTNANGIAVMEHGEYRIWDKDDGLRSVSIHTVCGDSNGNIFFGSTGGLGMIDKDMNLMMLDDPRVADAYISKLCLGSDGLVYGTTLDGDSFTLDKGEIASFIDHESSELKGIMYILPDEERPGYVYYGTEDCYVYYGKMGAGLDELEVYDVSPLSCIDCMRFISGRIWICSKNGIGALDKSGFCYLDNVPMNNNVERVMADYEGNLWFVSSRQGVMKIVANQFIDIFDRYDLPPSVVNATCKYGDQLFIGTDEGIIVLEGDKKVESIPATGCEPGDLIEYLDGIRIRSIVRDSKDRLWIATWRKYGLVCYDKGRVSTFDTENGLYSDRVRIAHERSDGSVMVANTGGVCIIRDGKVAESYGEESGIVNTEILTVEEGKDGDMILGSDGGGIYILGSGGTRHIGVEEGLGSEVVMRIKHDERNKVYWIITTNSIDYMDEDYNVTKVNKFPYPNNFDIYINSSNEAWIMAGNGLYVLRAEELLANEDISAMYYNCDNGLGCFATANSYCELTDEGELFIAGTTGVSSVNIDRTYATVHNLKATIPYIEADGEKVYPDANGAFTIPSDKQKITIPCFIFNYSLINPQVTYRLEGFDRQSTSVLRSDMVPVDYTNLRGNTYHFVLEIEDNMGHDSKSMSFTIIKEKKLHERIGFNIFAMVFLALLLEETIRYYVRSKTRKLKKRNQEAYEQFEQTAEALASAIDAKDSYTNGHSRRVAEYSLKIAKDAGKNKKECDKVYFAALLHDVGKIGVPIEILTKKSRLTDEEFEQIKQHPVVGGQILERIQNSPWLSIGARYHHERYNGKGYPEGLKGEEIPEIARIIAVADAYDAMTSNRSYRNAIPQHIVREELVKGIGTQFDPEYAKIMIHLLDLDTEYRMQETETGANLSPETSLRCDTIYNSCTDGVLISEKPTRIRLCSLSDKGVDEDKSLPSLIVFDCLDAKVHPGEEKNKDLLYYEYAQIRFDGHITEGGIRKSQISDCEPDHDLMRADPDEPDTARHYLIEAVRIGDHARIRISGEDKAKEIILALPDSSRFMYMALGGENCYIHNIIVTNDTSAAEPEDIPRIAEEISYIKGCPEGDVPNIEVPGWRAATTPGIPIGEGLTLSFHSRSLPVARLVWHCPYISVFSSADGTVDGDDLREYILLRLDGENWESDDHVKNKVKVNTLDSFVGWNAWNDRNKEGIDCVVTIRREKNRIIMQTENLGIAINSVTTINEEVKDVYVALTGDQCAITDIHISRDMQPER